VMAVKASPRKYEIQPVSLCERVDALQICQRSVGAKVQAKIRSRGGARLQTAERRVGPRSPTRLNPHIDPSAARQHSHGPHQLPTVGRSIVREVGPRTQNQRVRDPHVSTPVSVSYRWRATSSPSGVTLNCPPLA